MKTKSLFLLSLVAATSLCVAQSPPSPSLEKATDIPDKDYRIRIGENPTAPTVSEAMESQDLRQQLKELEAENARLKEQLKQQQQEAKKLIDLLDSLNSSAQKKEPLPPPK
jgi:septal ring factor EnvC (AmiA/AmiB activator)